MVDMAIASLVRLPAGAGEGEELLAGAAYFVNYFLSLEGVLMPADGSATTPVPPT